LERFPKDEISPQDYWKTPNDLKLYVNQFYTSFPVHNGWNGGTFETDNNSDNLANFWINERFVGDNNTVPNTGGGWSWGQIRSINFYLENNSTAQGNEDDIKHYNGEAYFFRAMFYFNLVKRFGSLPYIDKTLSIDSEELFSQRLPRNEIVDKIILDLDKAIENLKPGNSAESFRVHRGIALALKSNICLFEGTWEKYHAGTVFAGSSDNSTRYLTLAAETAGVLISEGNYSLYSNGDVNTTYWSLFNQFDYSGNSEVMFWKKYDKLDGVEHKVGHYIPRNGAGTGVTKSLVDSYLCKDGLPIGTSPLYLLANESSLTTITADRDPRLSQLICQPGDLITEFSASDDEIFEFPTFRDNNEVVCTTGYQIYKGGSTVESERNSSETGSIIYRYGEVLLNYAEAKAELGTLTQEDLDKSINLLRTRVGMPAMDIAAIVSDPNKAFPELSDLINEVRRERRVELSLEGKRLDDLLRWRAHTQFVGKRLKGFKLIGSDIETEFADLIGTSILVDDNGYIDPYKNVIPAGFGFNPLRDYLSPLPTEQLVLGNGTLEQKPGW
jgi:hypothetical protein